MVNARFGFKTLAKLFVIALLTAYFAFGSSITHAAVSSDQHDALSEGVLYFNTESCDSAAGSSSGSGTITGNGAWNSGLTAPFWLEEFVINVLQDIAKTENVDESKTVTQEHVVALVAWAYAEGGNIANTDWYNPWNTGLNRPDLIDGSAAGNGVQAFKSFDAGVTAATITMTGSNQNRLAKTLTDPNSTAEQFMTALTYYQRYPGNTFWAEADQQNQQGYYSGLISILKQTRANYAQYASVIIGKGEENQHHVPTQNLKYAGGTSNPTNGNGTTNDSGACPINLTSSVGCTNASGQQATGTEAIACQVKLYDTLSYSEGWHSDGSTFHSNCDAVYKGQKPPAMAAGHAVGPLCATDCSGLVSIAVSDLFNNDGSWTTYTMLTDPSNWKRLSGLSQVQPGDLIEPNADHVEVIESVNKDGSLETFAAHTSNTDQKDQVGPAHYPPSSAYVYLRYVGKGANNSSVTAT